MAGSTQSGCNRPTKFRRAPSQMSFQFRVSEVSRPKTHWGMLLLDRIRILPGGTPKLTTLGYGMPKRWLGHVVCHIEAGQRFDLAAFVEALAFFLALNLKMLNAMWQWFSRDIWPRRVGQGGPCLLPYMSAAPRSSAQCCDLPLCSKQREWPKLVPSDSALYFLPAFPASPLVAGLLFQIRRRIWIWRSKSSPLN